MGYDSPDGESERFADPELAYLYQRAEQELALAQSAQGERVVRSHYHLAGLYLDRVYSGHA